MRRLTPFSKTVRLLTYLFVIVRIMTPQDVPLYLNGQIGNEIEQVSTGTAMVDKE